MEVTLPPKSQLPFTMRWASHADARDKRNYKKILAVMPAGTRQNDLGTIHFYRLHVLPSNKSSAIMRIQIFWDMTPCQMVHSDRRFGRACCIHLQGLGLYMETKFPRNLGDFLTQTASCPRRLESPTALWQPRTSQCVSIRCNNFEYRQSGWPISMRGSSTSTGQAHTV
jgi:hypothetical protein